MLPNLSPEARVLVRNRLVVIATDLQFSRKLETKRSTRPDANFTLHVLARMALELLAVLEGLSEESLAKISERFDPSCLSYYEPGVAALEAVAIILDELAMAAYDAIHARAKRSDPIVERCAEIEGLQAAADLIATSLSRLPLQTAWALVTMQQYVALLPDFAQIWPPREFIARILRNFAHLAEAAYQIEISERGPDQDTAQFLAVSSLARMYEQVVGEAVSHTAHSKLDYKGEPQTPFGQLVTAFMVVAEPDPIKRHGTLEAVAYVAWPNKVKERGKKVRKLTTARHDKILSVLSALRAVTNYSHNP
jgi:hypothetical protein